MAKQKFDRTKKQLDVQNLGSLSPEHKKATVAAVLTTRGIDLTKKPVNTEKSKTKKYENLDVASEQHYDSTL